MGYKAMDNLREMLCREVDEIAEKGELSAGDLQAVHTLTDTIKNILKIEMLEEDGYSRDGYSRDGDWRAEGKYSRGRYPSNSYRDGDSYRGYSGRHYVRGHYSREDGTQQMQQRIEELMKDDSLDGNDRNILMHAMELLKR